MQSKVKKGTMMFVTKLAYSTYEAHILYRKDIFLFSPLPICQRKYLPVPPFLVIISPLHLIAHFCFDFWLSSGLALPQRAYLNVLSNWTALISPNLLVHRSKPPSWFHILCNLLPLQIDFREQHHSRYFNQLFVPLNSPFIL